MQCLLKEEKKVTHYNKGADKTLGKSFINGVFASMMTGFTQEYFTPFVLLMGATAQHVGSLNAFPNLFAALVQIKSADITEHLNSRKRIINIALLLQAAVLLPASLICLKGGTTPFTVIVLVILFTCFGAVANPPWGSFLSDLVRQDKKGDYFGWRNRVLGFVMVGSSIAAGFILHAMKKINVLYGFAFLFGAAFLWRMLSWYFLRSMVEPPLLHSKINSFSFFQFLARLRESNFGRFVVFVSLMSFSVNIASPFFAVLMLKDLKFSYLLYTFITMAATFTLYLTMHRWGRHADKVGNLKVITFTAPLIGVIPLLWVICRNPVFLLCAQVFSGFLWAGFNLCTSNFIYDAVTPEKRTRCIAFFNVFNGVALSAGALLGGMLLKWLPALSGHKILTLLVISSFLRIAVGLLMPRGLKEVRDVQSIDSNQLFFSMIGMRAIVGVERKTIRYL